MYGKIPFFCTHETHPKLPDSRSGHEQPLLGMDPSENGQERRVHLA